MTTQATHPDQQKLRIDEEAIRYSRQSILRSERMYGEGFQSPGGIEAVEGFCSKLHMREGMKILDFGSGLGGASFYFAERYSATVLGLDFSQNMVNISRERKERKQLSNVTFQQGDIRTAVLPENTFDLAWTRDCILYIAEKHFVWKNVYSSLKTGGQLFITDFCKGNGSLSESFITYLDRCGYHLQDLESYGQTLERAGFHNIRIEDHTKAFINSLQDELRDLNSDRDQFLREFSESDFDYLVNRWNKKIHFCEQGDFLWGLFIAEK
ncbi:MAG: methyltransferase domain-containing protein [Nitrospirota bacterium]|nr:methyltransferase domain-containing protein [Nitrospirota bacterium]